MSREVMYGLAALLVAAAVVLAVSRLREPLENPPPSQRLVVNAPAPLEAPMDFAQAIELFKQNYVAYKTTGRVEFRTAYENAQSWIEKYLGSMQNRISSGSRQITNFVSQQTGADTQLGKLGTTMKKVAKEGPATQDAYATIKRINEDVPEDNTNLYVKAGIAAALAGIAGIMSAV